MSSVYISREKKYHHFKKEIYCHMLKNVYLVPEADGLGFVIHSFILTD
jgi:hypothetical protein